ncbi:MAG: extracellular solute-binding protein [Polyangiaceae bacterium]|jgi:arabinosaccharide transport system substrate-binding protein
MVEKFPYGKAPFWLLAIALASVAGRWLVMGHGDARADLLIVANSPSHFEAYKNAVPRFERKHGVHVEVQFAHWTALQSRLESAMLAGADVPDLVELLEGSLGFFTRGPREDVGLLDLADRVEAEGFDRRLVASRLSSWSTVDGRIYALPNDVHPVMLAYRRDLVAQLGIDVTKLDTWDAFVEAGRRVTRDVDGDGVVDHYMIDLPYDGNWALTSLLLQHGGQLFDRAGNIAFNSDITTEVFAWYLRQTHGPRKIAYDAGWGQALGKAMVDGLVVFYWAPDWRSRFFADEVPSLAGHMALMPLPAWDKGGRRTSVWGGTGLMISRRTPRPDLAWELAKFLYFDPTEMGKRFEATNIIPVLRDAWTMPELDAPNPYYSNEPIGRMYADLAPDVPPSYVSPLTAVAGTELDEAFSRCVSYYERFGEEGLTDAIHRELSRAEAYVQRLAERANWMARAP